MARRSGILPRGMRWLQFLVVLSLAGASAAVWDPPQAVVAQGDPTAQDPGTGSDAPPADDSTSADESMPAPATAPALTESDPAADDAAAPAAQSGPMPPADGVQFCIDVVESRDANGVVTGTVVGEVPCPPGTP